MGNTGAPPRKPPPSGAESGSVGEGPVGAHPYVYSPQMASEPLGPS